MFQTLGLLLQVHGEGEEGREVLRRGGAAVCSCAGVVFHLGVAGDRSFVDLVGACTIQGVRCSNVLAAIEEDVFDGPGGVEEHALGQGGEAPSCTLGSWC